MEIAIRSVDNYSRYLFEKTGTKSRIGLVLWALKNNLNTTKLSSVTGLEACAREERPAPVILL